MLSFYGKRAFYIGPVCFAIALVLFGLVNVAQLGRNVVYASANPSVAIVVDITNKYGPCVDVFDANIGTPYASSTRIPCPAYSVTSIKIVRQSEAIAQHERYVIYPSPNAPVAEWLNMSQQLQQITQDKEPKLGNIHPLTRCGNTGSAYQYWTPISGYNFYSVITFFKSTDCTTIGFTTASLQVNSTPANSSYLHWIFDLYAGRTYNVPGCPDLTPGSHSHGVGRDAPPGYTYENWVDFYPVCLYPPARYHNDISPIS